MQLIKIFITILIYPVVIFSLLAQENIDNNFIAIVSLRARLYHIENQINGIPLIPEQPGKVIVNKNGKIKTENCTITRDLRIPNDVSITPQPSINETILYRGESKQVHIITSEKNDVSLTIYGITYSLKGEQKVDLPVGVNVSFIVSREGYITTLPEENNFEVVDNKEIRIDLESKDAKYIVHSFSDESMKGEFKDAAILIDGKETKFKTRKEFNYNPGEEVTLRKPPYRKEASSKFLKEADGNYHCKIYMECDTGLYYYFPGGQTIYDAFTLKEKQRWTRNKWLNAVIGFTVFGVTINTAYQGYQGMILSSMHYNNYGNIEGGLAFSSLVILNTNINPPIYAWFYYSHLLKQERESFEYQSNRSNQLYFSVIAYILYLIIESPCNREEPMPKPPVGNKLTFHFSSTNMNYSPTKGKENQMELGLQYRF